MCFGLLLALPHILFINLLINSLLTRIVLYTYILLFFVPIFALNSWLIGFDFVYIFFYVELFFITVIFGYFYFVYFFQLISSRKNDPSARAIASKKYKTSEGSSGSNIIFFIISGFFAVYFYLINPEHSGMLAYFENRDVLPRFAIYSSSDSFQLIFALYGRVLAPLAIFLAASKRSRIVVVLFALAILLNSVERQTVIICIFSYIVTLFIKQERVGINELL